MMSSPIKGFVIVLNFSLVCMRDWVQWCVGTTEDVGIEPKSTTTDFSRWRYFKR